MQFAKFGALFGVLLLMGCDRIALYYSVPAGSAYSFRDVRQVAATGGIPTEVYGKLPGKSASRIFNDRVRELMSDTINDVPVRFVDTQAPGASPKLRVVVWFNPSLNRKYLNLCTYEGGVALHDDAGRAEVAMALCSGPHLLSSSSGVFFFFRTDPTAGRRFTNLIKSTTAALFPIRVDREDWEFERWL